MADPRDNDLQNRQPKQAAENYDVTREGQIAPLFQTKDQPEALEAEMKEHHVKTARELDDHKHLESIGLPTMPEDYKNDIVNASYLFGMDEVDFYTKFSASGHTLGEVLAAYNRVDLGVGSREDEALMKQIRGETEPAPSTEEKDEAKNNARLLRQAELAITGVVGYELAASSIPKSPHGANLGSLRLQDSASLASNAPTPGATATKSLTEDQPSFGHSIVNPEPD